MCMINNMCLANFSFENYTSSSFESLKNTAACVRGCPKRTYMFRKQKCYDNNFVIFIIFLLPYKGIKIEGCTIPNKKNFRYEKVKNQKK